MKKIYFALALPLLLLTALFIKSQVNAQAPLEFNVTGWAWSSNIGWISMSSTNANSGGGSYGVKITADINQNNSNVSRNDVSGRGNVASVGSAINIDENGKVAFGGGSTYATTGTFSGYAWSPHIGWISFRAADSAGCGSGPVIDSATGRVSGFVRALKGIGRTDGWNGCISLSGSPNYSSPNSSGYQGASTRGVTMNPSTGVFSGYAWGGDVVGWINFNAGIPGAPAVVCAGCGSNASFITAACTASIESGKQPPGTSFTYTVSNVTGGTGSYTYSWNGTVFGNATTYSATVPQTGQTSQSVLIKDTSPNQPTTITCPGIAPIVGGLRLSVARTPATALGFLGSPIASTGSTITLHPNRKFALAWKNPLPAGTNGYTCNPDVQPAPQDSVVANWNSNWKNINLPKTSPNGNYQGGNTSENGLTTGDAAFGSYIFSINCNGNGTNAGKTETSSVTVRIVSVTEDER